MFRPIGSKVQEARVKLKVKRDSLPSEITILRLTKDLAIVPVEPRMEVQVLEEKETTQATSLPTHHQKTQL